MYQDVERCVRAVRAKDERFDGWFFTAVVTTGIYCRPSCPATPPKPANMRFYPSAAAAQQAGFRACKHCRPAPWRPWRAYAVQYLWSTGDHPMNQLPAGPGPTARAAAPPPDARPAHEEKDSDACPTARDPYRDGQPAG